MKDYWSHVDLELRSKSEKVLVHQKLETVSIDRKLISIY